MSDVMDKKKPLGQSGIKFYKYEVTLSVFKRSAL